MSESLAKHLDPESLSDTYRTQVQELINAKIEGREAETAPSRRLAPVPKVLGEKAEKSPQLNRKPLIDPHIGFLW